MKVFFNATGRYKAGIKTIISVEEKDVDKKTVFDIEPKFADVFINANKAFIPGSKPKKEKVEFEEEKKSASKKPASKK